MDVNNIGGNPSCFQLWRSRMGACTVSHLVCHLFIAAIILINLRITFIYSLAMVIVMGCMYNTYAVMCLVTQPSPCCWWEGFRILTYNFLRFIKSLASFGAKEERTPLETHSPLQTCIGSSCDKQFVQQFQYLFLDYIYELVLTLVCEYNTCFISSSNDICR